MDITKIIYAGIFLDDKSIEALKQTVPPLGECVYCHHSTLAFRPAKNYVKQFNQLLGHEYTLEPKMELYDGKAQCVIMNQEDKSLWHGHPHITISTHGVSPAFSNSLIAKYKSLDGLAKRGISKKTTNIQLKGKLGYFLEGGEIIYNLKELKEVINAEDN